MNKARSRTASKLEIGRGRQRAEAVARVNEHICAQANEIRSLESWDDEGKNRESCILRLGSGATQSAF